MPESPKKRKAQGGAYLQGRVALPVNADTLPPAFCLHHLQKNHGLDDCTDEEKAALIDTMYRLGQQTWLQLRANFKKHGLGGETINRGSIKAAHPPSVSADVTYLAYRFYGQAPMVGYRDGHVFYILWLDRDFTLYNH